MNAICPNIIRTNIAPNLFFDKVEARGHLTPMSGVLKAFTAMLEPSNISGEIFEIGPNGGYVRRDDPSTWTLKASKESMRCTISICRCRGVPMRHVSEKPRNGNCNADHAESQSSRRD